MAEITTNDIVSRIAAIDAKIFSLSFEAEELSLKAVSGDTDADARLAEIRTEQGILGAERNTLDLAKAAAGRNDEARRVQLRKTYRRNALKSAQETAGQMQVVAREIDRRWGELVELIYQLEGLERAMRRPQSILEIQNNLLGRGELADYAVLNLVNIRNPHFSAKRVSDLCELAWDDLQFLDFD